MNSLLNWDTLLDLLLGISLSAAAGFRVFVPLLIMSGAAVLGHFDLPPNFDWLETDQALIVFAAASLLEVAGYYIPFLDHFLDIIATPAAIVAGTVITASFTADLNPLVQWTLALIAGGGTAGLTKGMTNIIRAISMAVSAGLTNPLFATIELAIAILLTVLAITVPVFTGLLVISGLLFTAQKLKTLFNKPLPPPSNVPGSLP